MNPADWTCPLPSGEHPRIVLGHGGGGQLSSELVTDLLWPAFGQSEPVPQTDAAVLQVGRERLAFSTDTFVVHPLFFPGGDIGELAVNGTVNDLAMMGARPLFLSVGLILEEGFPTQELTRVAESMGAAARRAGIRLVTGDTKVVERGRGHGVYINTSGIGTIPHSRELGAQRVEPGDAVLVSGPLGDHGMAVMSVREGLQFHSTIVSDTAPLSALVEAMMEPAPQAVKVLRDPTRGGLAAACNEIARASGTEILLHEESVPVRPAVRAACELLGLDPLHVACEGRLMAVVDGALVESVLAAMRAHPLGREAVVLGTVNGWRQGGLVAMRTALGATRVVDTQVGEQLPRIC